MRDIFQPIKRFFSKSYSDDDLKNLFIWLNSEKGENEIAEELDKSWKSFEFDDNVKIDSRKILYNIKKRISTKKSSDLKQKAIRFLPYAAILVLAFLTTYLLFTNRTETPGSHFSTNSFTTIMTENAQRSRVVLPDSSIVWLNSGTTISYPADFFKTNRKVTLEGQAFFQVTHQENHPFEVETNGLIVKVLGTKFDVEAYPETGEIDVVLESGKVELTHELTESFNYVMKPGELATYSLSDKSMKISNINAAIRSSWKEGKLIFRNSSMKEVVEKLRRWYNVDITVADQDVYNSVFNGTIQNESYEEIFRLIAIASHLDCKINHNYEKESKPEIIISKK